MPNDQNREQYDDFIERLKKYEEALEDGSEDENEFDENFMNQLDSTLAQLTDIISNNQKTDDTKSVIKFVNKSDNENPKYANEGDSGFDLRADVPENEPITILPFKRALIPTGLFFELTKGYEIQVRPRSGLALKYGISVVNTPGTIDSHYRGEIKVILVNLGEEPFIVNKGDRIAQGVICPVFGEGYIDLKPTDSLDETTRGSNGFGSTGI